MSERSVQTHSGVMERLDAIARGAKGTAAVVMASLAMGGGMMAAETGAAQAKTPAARSGKAHKPKQVQEFVTVAASDPGGDALGTQPNTFAFTEKCKAKGRAVVRQAVYSKPNQPLGKCDSGKPVKVSEGQPLQGDWLHRSGTSITQKRNNHFIFFEQKVGGNTPAPQPEPTPTPSPSPTPTPTPTPSPGNGDPFASGNVGVDISWPQCGTANETPSGFAFGIVGVNNGMAYSANPCLASEASAFPGNQLNLYVNGGWYDQSSHIDPNSPNVCATGDKVCLANNYGWNAGAYAVSVMIAAGIDPHRRAFIQVNNENTWNSDTAQNRASIQGERDALIANGITDVGIYTITTQWNAITGNWINNYHSWGATTWDNSTNARTFCTGHEMTGGASVLMQYLPNVNPPLDYDVAC